MAMTFEVYLRCDSPRCTKKVAWAAPYGDEQPISDSEMEKVLRGIAKDEGWFSLDSSAWEGPERLFHSEKCVKDFLVAKRKLEIAESKVEAKSNAE